MRKTESYTDIKPDDIIIRWREISDRINLDLNHIIEPNIIFPRLDTAWPEIIDKHTNTPICSMSLEHDNNCNMVISNSWCEDKIHGKDLEVVRQIARESLDEPENQKFREMQTRACKADKDGIKARAGDIEKVKEILHNHGIDNVQKFVESKPFKFGHETPKLDGVEPINCSHGETEEVVRLRTLEKMEKYGKMGFKTASSEVIKVSEDWKKGWNSPTSNYRQCIFIVELPK